VTNYVTSDWKMRANYECRSCAFSSLDEEVMRYHQDAAHPVFPTQGPAPDEWPSVLTSAAVEPVAEAVAEVVPDLGPVEADVSDASDASDTADTVSTKSSKGGF
jgi:hypothetical protein